MTILLPRLIRTLGVIAGLTLMSGCGADAPGDEVAPSALMVTPFSVAASQQYSAAQRFSGQVEAARQSSLGFELGGELARVSVDEGDVVEAGAVLASLDRARLLAARQEAEAAVAQAKAQAELSAATFERVREARDFDGVSAQELDQALEQKQRAEANASAAGARLARINIDLSKSQLRAPYAGSIVNRFADEGQVLGAGQPVLEIQESAALEVRLAVTGEAATALVEGAKVDLLINEQPVVATVSAIIAQRNLRTRAIEVILEIGDGAAARVGDIAELSYERSIREPGFWVPLDALTEGAQGIWNVLAIRVDDAEQDKQNRRATGSTHALEKRPIEILYKEADRVYVRGALQDGDLIVADGLHRVVAGQGVRISEQMLAEREDAERM